MDKYYISGIRKQLKLSQKQLGDKLGVGSHAVYSWEAGIRNPSKSVEILLKLLLENKL